MKTSGVCGKSAIEGGKDKDCSYLRTKGKEPWTKKKPLDMDSTYEDLDEVMWDNIFSSKEEETVLDNVEAPEGFNIFIGPRRRAKLLEREWSVFNYLRSKEDSAETVELLGSIFKYY